MRFAETTIKRTKEGVDVMQEQLIVDARFNGPPDSGNGGYVCGLVANFIEGTAEITLRQPPPLNKPMQLVPQNGHLHLMDDELLVASGKAATLSLDIPAMPTMVEAETAVSQYTGFQDHIFPTCFVCGPERHEHDGLRIFTGVVDGRHLVAAPWETDHTLAGDNGSVQPEFIWSALDCPGAFAVMMEGLSPIVLGRLTATITHLPQAGQRCIVIGWPLGKDGRKHFAGTAVFTETGELCGKGQAVWIELE